MLIARQTIRFAHAMLKVFSLSRHATLTPIRQPASSAVPRHDLVDVVGTAITAATPFAYADTLSHHIHRLSPTSAARRA